MESRGMRRAARAKRTLSTLFALALVMGLWPAASALAATGADPAADPADGPGAVAAADEPLAVDGGADQGDPDSEGALDEEGGPGADEPAAGEGLAVAENEPAADATLLADTVAFATQAAGTTQVKTAAEWTSAITAANASAGETTVEIAGNFTLPAKTEITGKVRLTGSGTITFSWNGSSYETSTSGAPIKVNGGTLTIDSDGVTFSHTSSTGGGLFWIENGGSVVMNAGTIDNGRQETYAARLFIVVKGGSSFVMNGGAIQNVKIKQKMSLLYIESGATFRMTGGTISNIPAEHTSDGLGAVDIYGTFEMTGGTFSNCGIKDGDINGGSAVVVRSGGVANVSGGTFTANGSTSGSGGAMYVCSGGKLNLSGTTKLENNTGVNGGAIHVEGSMNMSGGEITGNNAPYSAASNFGLGGGIFVGSAGHVTFTGGAIHNNTAKNGGSDIFISSNNSVSGMDKLTTGQPFHETGAFCTDWHTENYVASTGVNHDYSAAKVKALPTVTNFSAAGRYIIGPGNSVTATFVNYDGTELQKSNVTSGTTPSYTGETPTKPSTPQYVYTFSGWSPTLGPITEDTTYTAQFTESANPNLTVYWLIPKSYATKAGYTVDDVIATRVLASSGSSGTVLGAYSTSSYVVVATTEIASGSAPVPPDMTQFAWYNNLLNGTTKTNATQVNSKMRPAWWQKAVLNVVYDAYFNFPEGVADTWYYELATSSWGSSMPKYDIADNKGAASLPETSTHIYYILGMEEYSDTAKTVSYEYTGTAPDGAPAAPGSSDVEPNAEVTVAAAPTMTGYTFSGWTATGVTVTDGKFTMPDTDVTFTGSWTVNKHKVTYQYKGEAPDGADAVPEEVAEYEYGKEFDLLVPAALEGYTFSGWTVKSPSGVEIKTKLATTRLLAASPASTPSNRYFVMPDSDVVLEGSWTVNNNTVTFTYTGDVPAGQTPPAAQTHDYGDTVTVPDAPTAPTGYTFQGWDKAEAFAMPDEDVTITGTWKINQYTITFDTDGGSAIDPITQDYNTPVTAPANPTKDGYTFAGWEPELPGTMPAENTTVKAKWTPTEYDISYTLNGGSVSGANPVKYTVESDTITLVNPTREGYTFTGWTGTGLTDPAMTVTIPKGSTGERSYTATWRANTNKVSYQYENAPAGAPALPGDSEPAYGATVAVADAPSMTGYTFAGWKTSDVTVANGSFVMPNKPVTFTGTWNPIDYTIRFVDEDGTELQSGSVPYGKTPAAPANPAKGEDAQYTYTFVGWDKDISPVTGDATYTAVYGKTPKQYTITFDTDGGSPVSPITQPYGSDVAKPADPTKPGYTFAGWEPEVPGTMPAENTTVKAKWTPIEYDVRFVNEDGAELQSGKLPYGETPAYTGATPVKADDLYFTYSFAGWDKEISPVTGDVTYRAVYEKSPIKRTVSFDSNGGSAVDDQSVTSGEPVAKPADPTRGGYAFKGWQLNGADYDFSTPVTGDITLVAKWEAAPAPAPTPAPAEDKPTPSADKAAASADKPAPVAARAPATGDPLMAFGLALVAAVALSGMAIVLALRLRRQ